MYIMPLPYANFSIVCSLQLNHVEYAIVDTKNQYTITIHQSYIKELPF
jgi:hypothetical protein